MFSFRSGNKWFIKAELLKPLLQRTLSSSRYKHGCRVAHVARLLARKHGVNPGKAWFAGLLHDLAREWTEERLLTWVNEHGSVLEPAHLLSPVLAHGHAGAWLLESVHGIKSKSILAAVANHTLGHPRLDKLGLIIFAADYLEPGRKFTSPGFRRWAMHLKLNEMVLVCIAHNEARGKASSSLTLELKEHLSKSSPSAIVLTEQLIVKDLAL